MQIEVGKYYRTRDGRKVGPMALASNADWVGRCETEKDTWGFHKSGRFGTITGTADGPHRTDSDKARDLIAEWTDPLPHGHARLSDGRVIDLTAITTPLGLLDEVHGPGTQAAMRAHGGPYEAFDGEWREISRIYNGDDGYAYRVKPTPPAPKVETVTLTGGQSNGWGFYENKARPISHTHRITLTIIDGVVQPTAEVVPL